MASISVARPHVPAVAEARSRLVWFLLHVDPMNALINPRHPGVIALACAGLALLAPSPTRAVPQASPGPLLARRPGVAAFERVVARRAPAQPLHGFHLVGSPHFYRSTRALVHAIARSGVAPEHTLYIADPKSAVVEVIQPLRAQGFKIAYGPLYSPGDHGFYDPDANLEGILRGTDLHQERIAGGLAGDSRRRWLVADESGDLIRFINHHFPELKGRVHAVIGTSGGSKRVDQIRGLWIPVVDVGRARDKLELESPIIAVAIGNGLASKLGKLRRHGIEPGSDVIQFGYGPLGQAMADELHTRGMRVGVYDELFDHPGAEGRGLREEAARRGAAPLTRQQAIERSGIVLSVTGSRDTIRTADLDHLRAGTILVNGAQRGAVETRPELFADPFLHEEVIADRYVEVTRFQGRPFIVGPRYGLLGDYVLRSPAGHELLLAHNNFSVNHSNHRRHAIPPRYAQLRLGLDYLGLLQAARTTEPGVHALDLPPQDELTAEIEQDLAAWGESVHRPRF
jgi:hypothetical protein